MPFISKDFIIQNITQYELIMNQFNSQCSARQGLPDTSSSQNSKGEDANSAPSNTTVPTQRLGDQGPPPEDQEGGFRYGIFPTPSPTELTPSEASATTGNSQSRQSSGIDAANVQEGKRVRKPSAKAAEMAASYSTCHGVYIIVITELQLIFNAFI